MPPDDVRFGPSHVVFAWRPVKTDWTGWVWLRRVDRRRWVRGDEEGWNYRRIRWV